MRKIYFNGSRFIMYGLLMLKIAACNTSPDPVPFPENESEFLQPKTEKLNFTDPKELKWITLTSDSVQPPVQKTFDLDKLPSKAFVGFNLVPLLQPMPSKNFKWDSLTDTIFDWNNIPSKKLEFKISLLGEPLKVKAGYPRLKDGATESILLFGQDQGLSGTVVSSFSQDKNGILWIATDNGVNRFDGEYFEIYTRLQGFTSDYKTGVYADSKGQIWSHQILPSNGLEIIDQKTNTLKHLSMSEGLSNNGVSDILEDKKGRLWISTWNGLNVLDEKEGTIRNITRDKGIRQNRIRCMMEDKEGRIWIGMYGKGIDVIDEKAGKILHLDSSSGLINNKIITLAENAQGEVWVGTEAGLDIIDMKAGKIKQLNHLYGLNMDFNIRSIAFDKQGHAWIGTWGAGVEIFDPVNETIRHMNTQQGLSNDLIVDVFVDANDQVWIGTFAGEINIYDPNGGSLQHLTAAQGLNNKSTWYYALAEDNKNRKWIGTLGEGIDVINEKNRTIQHISTNEGLSGNNINEILPDSRGRLWIASGSGIDLIDEKARTIKTFGSEQGLRFNSWTSSLLEDRKGRIWIGKGAVYVYDESENTIKFIRTTQGLTNNNISDLVEDNSGEIWVATVVGISLIDATTNTIKSISNEQLKQINTLSIIKDSRGLIWICTQGNGLVMVNLKAGSLTSFSIREGLMDRLVLSVIERNGSIYAGTGKGLSILTPQKNLSEFNTTGDTLSTWKIKSYGKPQGFLRVDHNPTSLLSKDGRLWWAIADVLTIMKKPMENSMVPTPHISGLDIMEKPQYFKSHKWTETNLKHLDTIWSISMDTFYLSKALPPDTGYLQKNNIVWDGINLNGLPTGLELPYDQNHLTFRFMGTHLDNLNKTRYRYILEGNDDTWSGITDKSFADYRNLSPGKYVFKVNSRGFNGLWSNPAEIRFTILPPWWKSWWAYSFYALCFIVALFIVDRIQRRRLVNKEREKAREKELQQAREIEEAYHELKSTQAQLIQSEKMASLGELTAGIAHEIQNPLNFINNFSEVSAELVDELKKEIEVGNKKEVESLAAGIKQNMEKIAHHGRRADSIVKNMLHHSRQSAGLKEMTDINALVDEYLRLSYHGLRAKDKSFNVIMETDFDPTIGKVNIISQDMGRVLLNLFNNAFYSVMQKRKLSGNGFQPTIIVRTKRVGNKLEMYVRDNGLGIPQKVLDKIYQPFFTTKPAGEGTGLGLSMSYDIITKGHGGDLKVETTEGEFASFNISLPV